MSPVQPTNFFAVVAIFFGFSFVPWAGAKAAASPGQQIVRSDSGSSVERALSLASAKRFGPDADLGQWFPWSATVPEGIEFDPRFGLVSRAPSAVHFICAKKFFIHTGLSPPQLFI